MVSNASLPSKANIRTIDSCWKIWVTAIITFAERNSFEIYNDGQVGQRALSITQVIM